MPLVPVSKDRMAESVNSEKTYKPQSPIIYVKFVNEVMQRLRVLPGWTEEGPWAGLNYIRIYQHWKVGRTKFPINCPRKMIQPEGSAPCFICEQIEMLRNTKAEADKKLASEIRPQRSFLYQVIDMDDSVWTRQDKQTQDNKELIGKPKIKILSVRLKAHRQITNLIGFSSHGDVTDPSTGKVLEFTRLGSEGNTVFTIIPVANSSYIFEKSPGVPDEKKIMEVGDLILHLDEHPYFQPAKYLATRAAFTGEKLEDLQKQYEHHMLPAQQPAAPQQAALPAPQQATRPAPTAPPALPPARQAPPQYDRQRWETITQQGIPNTGEEWVQQGVFSKPDEFWCYGLQPSPYDKFCMGCKMVAHCTALYQKMHNVAFHGGPPLHDKPQVQQTLPHAQPAPNPQAPPQGRNIHDVQNYLTNRKGK